MKRRVFILFPDETDISEHVIVQPVELPETTPPAKSFEPRNERPQQSL